MIIVLGGTASAFELPLEQQSSGAYYVRPGPESGFGGGLLLDTGSSYVGLTQQAFRRFERAGQLEFLRQIVGRMADGKTRRVSLYRLEELRLAADCVLHDVEVALIPGSDRNILGLSALRQMEPLTLTMTPPRLQGDHCAGPAAASLPVSVAQ